jgi:hypothetical protein
VQETFLHIGQSRNTVLQNRDIVKELRIGMLIAVTGKDRMPKVGRVHAIPPNFTYDSSIPIQWMIQERAPHKPKWMRHFKQLPLNSKNAFGNVLIQDITLYGFELTRKGCLKKKSREYLQRITT